MVLNRLKFVKETQINKVSKAEWRASTNLDHKILFQCFARSYLYNNLSTDNQML